MAYKGKRMSNVCIANKAKLEVIKPIKIPYKQIEDRELNLYVYLPKGNPTGCVLCVHGGGWRSETPMRLAPHAAYFAENGAIGISVEYRLISENLDVRNSLEDCVDALLFTRGFLKEKYGDLPITALGDSAGAYLAVCLGNSKILNKINANLCVVDYIVDLNGIVDLTEKWNYAILEKMGENKKEIEKNFSPLYNVSKDDSPVLIIHGADDKTVVLADSQRYADALNMAGIKNELVVLDNTAHAFILFDYRHDNTFVEQVLMMIAKKLKEVGVI